MKRTSCLKDSYQRDINAGCGSLFLALYGLSGGLCIFWQLLRDRSANLHAALFDIFSPNVSRLLQNIFIALVGNFAGVEISQIPAVFAQWHFCANNKLVHEFLRFLYLSDAFAKNSTNLEYFVNYSKLTVDKTYLKPLSFKKLCSEFRRLPYTNTNKLTLQLKIQN